MEAGEFATIQELAEAVGLAERHVSRQLRLAYLAQAVMALFGYAHFADRIHALHSLPEKHVNMPQLLKYFLGLVPFVRHSLSSAS